jgi:hypothetical protein
MCEPDPREPTLSNLHLPDDVMHVVFLKLNFMDKVNTGIVCKQWDQLPRAGTAAARHWVFNYNVDSKAFTREEGPVKADPNMDFGRYVTVPGLSFIASTDLNQVFSGRG